MRQGEAGLLSAGRRHLLTGPPVPALCCSVVGETKTLASGHLEDLKFAQVCCSNCEAKRGGGMRMHGKRGWARHLGACWRGRLPLGIALGGCLHSSLASTLPLAAPPTPLSPGGFGLFHVYDLAAQADGLDFVLHCG